MESPNFTPQKYFAENIVAFSDSELDQYLKANRLDGGAMVIEVEDPENLPETFIQRLRDRAHYTTVADQSRPVDPGQLTSRLLDLSSDRNTSSRPPTPPFECESSEDTLPPTPRGEREKRSYNELVEEGGRPFFDIDLVDDIAEDPFSHWDLVRPWAYYPADSDPDPNSDAGVNWRVFALQLWHWRMFRDWQRFNRNDHARWDDTWGDLRGAYDRFDSTFRHRCPTYTDAVKKLLAEYGFTRPFQFHADPTQQDRLTTWIEYLGYECWLHYRCASRAKNLQPKYNAAWKTLVDSNTMRPFETEGYVCAFESSPFYQSEEDRAIRTVTSAKLAGKAVLTTVYNPRGPRLTPAVRMQMLLEAKSRCEAAEQALASVMRRNSLVGAFKRSVGTYLESKLDAMQHNMRVRWALEQVPLIEAELNSKSPVASCSTKRRLERDEDETTQDPTRKKQRRDAGERPIFRCKDGPSYQKAKPRRSRDDASDAGPPFKRWKRRGEDMGSHVGTWDGADALAGDSPEFAEVGRPPSGHRLQRRKSTRQACQSSTSSQPLRRSARVAARQETLQAAATATRQGATKSELASAPSSRGNQLRKISRREKG